MCDIQGNLQDGSQVVVSVIFENKSDSFLKSMEFNVLDSLNSKLQRPEGSGPHDGLTVPFQLPPGQLLSKEKSCMNPSIHDCELKAHSPPQIFSIHILEGHPIRSKLA